MLLSLQDRRARYLLFALLALTIHVVDGYLVRTVDPARQWKVAVGAALDFVGVVTALYFFLLVRPGIRPRQSMVVVMLVGVIHAAHLFPGAVQMQLAIAGVAEVALLVYLAAQVRRPDAEGDPVDAIHAATARLFPNELLARLVAAELSVLYYALCSWRGKPHVPVGAEHFTVHERSGKATILSVACGAAAIELVVMHWLLQKWSPVAAWVATAIGAYGMLWLIGFVRSLGLRPSLVSEEGLDIRYGLAYRLRVRWDQVKQVRPARPDDQPVLPRGENGQVTVEFTETIEAVGPLGIRKPVKQIVLAIDGPLPARLS